MKRTFRGAVVASTILHSVIFVPFLNIAILPIDKKPEKDMVVDYIVTKEVSRPKPSKIAMDIKKQETPRVELAKTVDIKPVDTPKPAETRKSAPVKAKTDDRMAKKEAAIKTTKDYVGYYQFIREKIRQKLKNNYRSYRREGDVRILFTLDARGVLKSVGVDAASSVDDRALHDIAIMSVKDAAPFPNFPKALSLPKMSFDVVVSFRKE